MPEELDELLELDELELLLEPVVSPPQPELNIAMANNEIHTIRRRVLFDVMCRVHCLLVSLLEPQGGSVGLPVGSVPHFVRPLH